jgi:hypothetical protein
VRAIVGAVEIAVHIVAPTRRIRFGEGKMVREAGVVDQDIDAAELAGERREGPRDRLGVADVENRGFRGETFVAEPLSEAFQGRAAIDGGNFRPFGAEIAAERLADPTVGAGDRDCLACERHAAPSIAARPSAIQFRLASLIWPQL